MKRKEWQNLHDELMALNEEFKINLGIKQEIRNRKQKKEADDRLSYIMELAYARITGNDKAYQILVADIRKDECLVKATMMKLSDENDFSDIINIYLEKVREKF
jgi:hypothetical protein